MLDATTDPYQVRWKLRKIWEIFTKRVDPQDFLEKSKEMEGGPVLINHPS